MLVVVPAVLVATLGLGACRGAERSALPASGVSSPSPAARVGSGASGSSADPLAGIESTVDSVERDVDSDARDGSGTGTGSVR